MTYFSIFSSGVHQIFGQNIAVAHHVFRTEIYKSVIYISKLSEKNIYIYFFYFFLNRRAVQDLRAPCVLSQRLPLPTLCDALRTLQHVL